MKLFLFNVSDRRLHGIFRATSQGSWEINPSGGCKKTTRGGGLSGPDCQVEQQCSTHAWDCACSQGLGQQPASWDVKTSAVQTPAHAPARPAPTPAGWAATPHARTSFPAQVEVEWTEHCLPLGERCAAAWPGTTECTQGARPFAGYD